MYKILTIINLIHLNYKFKKRLRLKNIQIHGLSDCLAKGVKMLSILAKGVKKDVLSGVVTLVVLMCFVSSLSGQAETVLKQLSKQIWH